MLCEPVEDVGGTIVQKTGWKPPVVVMTGTIALCNEIVTTCNHDW